MNSAGRRALHCARPTLSFFSRIWYDKLICSTKGGYPMKKLARQWLSCLPGVGASLGIAVVATLLADLLDKLLGTHLISLMGREVCAGELVGAVEQAR